MLIFFSSTTLVLAQEKLLLQVDSMFTLAEHNSKQLDIIRYKIGVAENSTLIEKEKAYLPNAEASFGLGYISNAHVWDNKFDFENTVKMPHVANNFSIAAGYTVFNGGASKNRIAKAKLEEQIAQLDYEKNKEDIQFLLLAKYLDLFAYQNQENVYQQNILLANKRLSNIEKLIEQGMLTHNDKVRSELQLTDFKQKLNELHNNISVVNHELTTILGLPKETEIEVDTLLYAKNLKNYDTISNADNLAVKIPEIKIADIHTKLAEKQINIAKSSLLPSVSLYAEDIFNRPFISAIPPADIYMHLFQVGVKVKYDIGSLYKNKHIIQQANMERNLSQKNAEWLTQKSEMEIHTALIKLQDAQEKYISQQESYRLAQDNYHVVEQKYLNKFVTITDMLDASTSLLAAQINMNNARIGIIYQYYHLYKTSGLWEEVNN
ncbi:TolC family protein [Empedobacter brevis]|uniref:TolC family protein n=1 Tax=Empedobacter brevis TaxID=247 RepID=UPI0039AED95E